MWTRGFGITPGVTGVTIAVYVHVLRTLVWAVAHGRFQMPCLPGDALCGLPVNPSDMRWQHSDILGGASQAAVVMEQKYKNDQQRK